MKKFILFVALTAAVGACVPRYRIMVSETEESNRPFYTPMIKQRGFWNQGTPVLNQNEAINEIHEWKRHQAHIKRARRPIYIKVK